MEQQINERQRQLAYMEKASSYVEEQSRKLGRKVTCCVTTFGCQMNLASEIGKNML